MRSPSTAKPWGWVFRQAASPSEQSECWKNQFVEPAGLILSGGIREADVVDGDEPVEGAGASSAFVHSGSSPPRGGRDKRKRAADDDDQGWPMDSNRKGDVLQTGACEGP